MRGHNYVGLFVDLEAPRVLFATDGKDASTLERFKTDLETHHGNPSHIREICCDMSPAFIKDVENHFPEAPLTFDKFHVLKILNEAVDEVRRQEQQDRPELKRTRYLWLKNPGNLKANQAATLDALQVKKLNLKTARAYHIRLNFQEFWNQPLHGAEVFLKKWCFWATHSRLEPIRDAAHTMRRHWDGILRWFIPAEIRVYTAGAASVLKVMDQEIGAFKTQTYTSLYKTYKNDMNAMAAAVQSGDFSPFYRYCLFYGIATADWSSPDVAKASACNIARDQFALYQWYSSHTMKGAVIGTARTQAGDRAGLTDEAIASGVKGIDNQFRGINDQGSIGMLGALITAQFVKIAKESQCAANPVYCPQTGQRLCGASSEQHTVSVHNKTNQTVLAKVRVLSPQAHCENHICDMNGPLKPGESKMCAVYGRLDSEQVQIYVQA